MVLSMTFKETVKSGCKKVWQELNKPRGSSTFNGKYVTPEQRKELNKLKAFVETVRGKRISDKELDRTSFSDPDIANMGAPKAKPKPFDPSDPSGCGGSWDI